MKVFWWLKTLARVAVACSVLGAFGSFIPMALLVLLVHFYTNVFFESRFSTLDFVDETI